MTEQLQEMKARLEAATPGPWVTGWDGQEYYVAPEWSNDYPHERITEWTYAIHPGNSMEMGECATQNAELIAHAPETQAKLIAALEGLLEWAAVLDEHAKILNLDANRVAAHMRKIITEALA